MAGHQRIRALTEQGATEFQVVQAPREGLEGYGQISHPKTGAQFRIRIVEWDRAKHLRGLLTANNPANQGQWTSDLGGALDELGGDPMSEPLLLDDLEDERESEEQAGEDGPAPPPPVRSVTKRGDLWLLGEHRILCGDSTVAKDVETLMGGLKARLMATDPPYLVNYRADNHPQSWANSKRTKEKSWDDYKDPKEGAAFFERFLKIGIRNACADRVPVYQWHAGQRVVEVMMAWRALKMLPHQFLIWVKSRPVLARCDFMWQHEPCLYGWVQGRRPNRRPPANSSTVWSIDQKGEQDGIHPTQKPVELFRRPIAWHTRKGDVVYEPFSGSGTQIVAAEQLGRRCYAMEIEPAFVDVAVLRWQRLTGKVAVHAKTKRKFEMRSEPGKGQGAGGEAGKP